LTLDASRFNTLASMDFISRRQPADGVDDDVR